MEIIRTVFRMLLPIAFILAAIVGIGEASSNSAVLTKKEKASKTMSTIRMIELVVLVLLLFGALYLIYIRHKEWAWVFVIFSAPLYLSYIRGTYLSLGIIKHVVESEKNGELSQRESWAIETAAYTVWLLDLYAIPNKLMGLITNLDNMVVSDILFVVVYAVMLFIYFFLSCALLPIPLRVVTHILIKVKDFVCCKAKLYQIESFFISKIEYHAPSNSLTIRVIENSKKCHMIYQSMVWIVVPVLILFDACLDLTRMLWSLMLSAMGYVFLLLRMIRRTFGRITRWVNSLSGRHLVAISFRIALIVALTWTVITNRYTPLFRVVEASTGVLEFVASAIVIPVILEWISSTKIKMD